MLSGPMGWIQEGFTVCSSAQGHQRGHAYALDRIVSTVTDGTLYDKCISQFCKCFRNTSMFSLHAAEMVLFTSHCAILHNLISLHNTGLCEDGSLSLSCCSEPIHKHAPNCSTPARQLRCPSNTVTVQPVFTTSH